MTLTLRPYQFISTPAISLLLDAIADHCQEGELIAPGVRQLAEWAGVSEGCVSRCLRTLAKDQWIDYDGRVIMLLIAPDQRIDRDSDQTVDQDSDQTVDRAVDQCVDRIVDQCVDQDAPAQQNAVSRYVATARSHARVLEPTTTSDSESVVVVESDGGMQGGGRHRPSPARDHPILLLLIELGLTPGPGVFERGMAARDWTPQQTRDRYEYDKPRIENSGGKKHWGIFWTAFMAGELAPARPDPTAPLDPASYAGRADIMLGSAPPPAETIRDRALILAGQPTAETIGSYSRDVVFLQCRLGMGDSDEIALQALAEHRKRVAR